MAGPFRERIFGVLVKPETTSGVDAAPTALANAVRVVGIPVLSHNFMDTGDRSDTQTGILSAAEDAAPAGYYGRIDLRLELKGAAAVYSASIKPEADALWRISGLGVTTDFTGGAEFYRYSTLDTAMETGTMYCYSANKLFKLVGCVAQPKLSTEVYKRGFIDFTVTGKITSVTEIALPGLTLSSVVPPLFHSAAASITGGVIPTGAWTNASTEPLMLLSAAVDFGTAVADVSSAGATDGLVGWLITDRNVTQDLTFYAPSLATYDPIGLSRLAADQGGSVLTAWQVGNTQYNRAKVESRWKPKPPTEASRNGLKTYAQSGTARVGNGLTSGREIQITYN